MRVLAPLCLLVFVACDPLPPEPDAGKPDSGIVDAGHDAGVMDAGPMDAGCAILFPPGSMTHFSSGSTGVQASTWCERVCALCENPCAPGVVSTPRRPHGLKPMQRFSLTPGEEFFPAGNYVVVSVIDDYTFGWAAQPEEFVRRNDLPQCLRLVP